MKPYGTGEKERKRARPERQKSKRQPEQRNKREKIDRVV